MAQLSQEYKLLGLIYEMQKLGASNAEIAGLIDRNLLNEDTLSKLKKYGKGALAGLGLAALGGTATSYIAQKSPEQIIQQQEYATYAQKRGTLLSLFKQCKDVIDKNQIKTDRVDYERVTRAIVYLEKSPKVETKDGREQLHRYERQAKEYPDDFLNFGRAGVRIYTFSKQMTNNNMLKTELEKFIKNPNIESIKTISSILYETGV